MAASSGSSSSTNGLLPTSLSEQNQHDMEAGGGGARVGLETGFDEDAAAANDMPADPFDIAHTKNAPHKTLRRWRQAALVLNASRRFRYTMDLKAEEEKENGRRMIRSHAQVIRAASLFKLVGERGKESWPDLFFLDLRDSMIVIFHHISCGIGTTVASPTPSGDYGSALDQLVTLTRENNIIALLQYRGVKGISALLKSNVEKGIHGDEMDVVKRKEVFGSNTLLNCNLVLAQDN